MTALTDEEVDQIATDEARKSCRRNGIEILGSHEENTRVEYAILGARAVAAKLSGGAGDPVTGVYMSDNLRKIIEALPPMPDGSAHLTVYATPPAATGDMERELTAIAADLAAKQEPLGAEFEAIWDANADKLYESDAKPVPVSDDLVERLRALLRGLEQWGDDKHPRFSKGDWREILGCLETSATRITADAEVIAGKDAEIEAYRGETEHQMKKRREQYDRAIAAEARITDLQADLKRTREDLSSARLSLERISKATPVAMNCDTAAKMSSAVRAIADTELSHQGDRDRAALTTQGGGD